MADLNSFYLADRADETGSATAEALVYEFRTLGLLFWCFTKEQIRTREETPKTEQLLSKHPQFTGAGARAELIWIFFPDMLLTQLFHFILHTRLYFVPVF